MESNRAERSNAWALVLAGGEGSRLHGLTRNSNGLIVPKQFCSLHGGPSLLQESLKRATSFAPPQQVCTVVAAHHRQWWRGMVSELSADNVIVQPHSRGTAHAILYPLLKIAARNPKSLVVLLPADHYVCDEGVMSNSLRRVASLADADGESIYLLGAEPEEVDTELGYIVPASRSRNEPARVLRFVEKPSASRVQALLDQGGLWNVFIVAATVHALLRLFGGSFASTIMAMRGLKAPAFDDMYEQLRSIDFSRDVLPGNEGMLKVLPVPHCGWTDLGTPQRVAATLKRLAMNGDAPARRVPVEANCSSSSGGYLNLADQYAWQQSGRGNVAKFGHAELHA